MGGLGAILAFSAAVTSVAQVAPQVNTLEDGTTCIGGICLPQAGKLKVNALSPPCGPLDGGTRVIVIGSGFRNFGPLMKCRFGTQEVAAALSADKGFIDPYNHTLISCQAPESPTPFEQAVALEVSLNGEEFSSGAYAFHYYRHPAVHAISPSHGSASTSQHLTLSRSTAEASGAWSPAGNNTIRRCRFTAVIQPDGKRQRQYSSETAASVSDETELQCATPIVDFVAPVHVQVTLNGQQYSPSAPIYKYEDNWHSPAFSGSAPSPRANSAAALHGSDIYMFGGDNDDFDGGQFIGDMCAPCPPHTPQARAPYSRTSPSPPRPTPPHS